MRFTWIARSASLFALALSVAPLAGAPLEGVLIAGDKG